jgi:SAM-dependent methyltransferase
LTLSQHLSTNSIKIGSIIAETLNPKEEYRLWYSGRKIIDMQSRWETFAKEDARFYICSIDGMNEAEFWKSGEQQAEEILSTVDGLIHSFGTVLDIGCGIGRVLLPMAKKFYKCIGLDVAPSMLSRLEENAECCGLSDRITGILPDDNWPECDFVYSCIVFQHIEDWNIICGYVKNIAKSLKVDGVAYLHFDTRPANIGYKLRKYLPDFTLPRTHKKGIRRIRRNSAKLRQLIASHGLTVIKESDPDTNNHIFIVKHSK